MLKLTTEPAIERLKHTEKAAYSVWLVFSSLLFFASFQASEISAISCQISINTSLSWNRQAISRMLNFFSIFFLLVNQTFDTFVAIHGRLRAPSERVGENCICIHWCCILLTLDTFFSFESCLRVEFGCQGGLNWSLRQRFWLFVGSWIYIF